MEGILNFGLFLLDRLLAALLNSSFRLNLWSVSNEEGPMEADNDNAQDIDIAAKEEAKINYSRPKKVGRRVKAL